MKENIIDFLERFESRESSREIVEAFKGVPLIIWMLESNITEIERMKKEIEEHWKAKLISVDGRIFNDSNKDWFKQLTNRDFLSLSVKSI
jgi:hypothetical protein